MSMAGDSAGFESYLRGSWWDVQIKEVRSSRFLVSYNADKDEDMAWVPLTELRLSSRRADGWDCSILRKGIDVSVLSKHPHSNSLNLQKEGLYDAKITSVARSIHAPGECTCKFSLIFFGIKVKTYIDGSLVDRKPLANEPETQVSISEVRILQKPSKKISFQDVMDAHLARKWIPFGRGCKSAYFLTETDLSTVERPRGVCAHEVDHTGPAPSFAPMRSDDDGWVKLKKQQGHSPTKAEVQAEVKIAHDHKTREGGGSPAPRILDRLASLELTTEQLITTVEQLITKQQEQHDRLMVALAAMAKTSGHSFPDALQGQNVYRTEQQSSQVPRQEARFAAGVSNVAALSLGLNYPTLAAAPHMFVNGFKNLVSVALATEYSFPQADTIKEILKDPSKFIAAAPVAATESAVPAAAAQVEEKEEETEESDYDMGFSLYD